jgi:hypothetical protein
MFEVVFASQDVIPGTEKVVVANIREEGVQFSLHPDVTLHVSSNIEGLVKKTLEHVGVVKGWNDLFWLMHPGGRAILQNIAARHLGSQAMSILTVLPDDVADPASSVFLIKRSWPSDGMHGTAHMVRAVHFARWLRGGSARPRGAKLSFHVPFPSSPLWRGRSRRCVAACESPAGTGLSGHQLRLGLALERGPGPAPDAIQSCFFFSPFLLLSMKP